MSIASRLAVVHLRRAVQEGEAAAAYVKALEGIAVRDAGAEMAPTWVWRELSVYEMAREAAHHAREWLAYEAGEGRIPEPMQVRA